MDAENDIVISGISACFPQSDNLEEFGQNLFDKKDLTSTEYVGAEKIPFRCGKIKEKRLTKMDAPFFFLTNSVANVMDPMARLLFEKTFEAILDAGINPSELMGTKTGVYVGVFEVDSAASYIHDDVTQNVYGYLGRARYMFANRLSYWLGVTGPSFAVDTACSSSLQALDAAIKDFKIGDIDAAIVAACNICIKKSPLYAGKDVTINSPGVPSKSFDESADGYCRAETVGCLFLQKTKNARRIHARILNVKTNHNGNESGSLTLTSVPAHCRMIEQLYAECGVDRLSIGYIEAHGTGTRDGDLTEMKIIEKSFCENREGPLLVGSVKSNAGHAEAASGLTAIAKIIYAYRVNKIPPNLHFVTPRKDIEVLNNGQVKIVTEMVPFPNANKLVGVINMGFGGTNAHLLLAPNPKLTAECSSPRSTKTLPRLVAVSGRTMEAVDTILDDLQSKGIDDEYIGLYREIFKTSLRGYNYRGYTILNENANSEPIRYTTPGEVPCEMKPIWFIFTGAGCQWPSMGKCLMEIPICADSIRKSHEILWEKNLNLIDIITDKSDNIYLSAEYMVVGITAIQIALVDLLRSVNIVADGIIGHSVGEIASAYADGSITFEQAVLIAYYRGKCFQEANFVVGAMASVGLDENELKRILPSEICIACHNSSNNHTISGPADKIDEFIAQLSRQDASIFIRKVNSNGLASHSPYIASVRNAFLQCIKNIITSPRERSNKWISTCFLEEKWETDEAKFASTEYFASNIVNPVYFRQACAHVPKNAIVIEVAPDCVLQAILKRTLDPDVSLIPMMSRKKENNLQSILESLGRIYTSGAQPQIQNLYPKVSFPVSRNTPLIAPSIRWDHTEDYFVTRYYDETYKKSYEQHYTITLADPEYEYLKGHAIRGRIMFPAAGYLFLVWKSFGYILDKMYSELSIRFENVKFQRTILMTENECTKVSVVIHENGQFEISENKTSVVSGKISELDEETNEPFDLSPDMKISDDPTQTLNAHDIYNELALRGYHYGGLFKAIVCMNLQANVARVQWKNNFVPFIDALLQFSLFQLDARQLFVPIEITNLTINVRAHYEELEKLDKENPVLEAYLDRNTKSMKCGGLVGNCPKGLEIPNRATQDALLQKIIFVPFYNRQATALSKVLQYSFDLHMKNSKASKNVRIMAIYDRKLNFDGSSGIEMIAALTQNVPTMQFSFTVLTDQTDQAPPPDNLKNLQFVNELPEKLDYQFIIVDQVSKNKNQVYNTASKHLDENGFLTLVHADENETIPITDHEMCADYSVDGRRAVMFRKVIDLDPNPTVIFIRSDSFSWITDVKKSLEAVADDEKKLVLLVAEKDRTSGIIGLFNCLGREYGMQNIRCYFIVDESAPSFTLKNPLYQSQYRKNLVFNIYENGSWGFYAHLLVSPLDTVKTHHAFVDEQLIGDLSSLRWFEGPLNPMTYKTDGSRDLVHIYYCALNFRDILLATGKLPRSAVARNRMQEKGLLSPMLQGGETIVLVPARLQYDMNTYMKFSSNLRLEHFFMPISSLTNHAAVHGYEFAGKLTDGTRVMGMTLAGKGLATLIEAERKLLWKVPENWSLEDASTVPVVYATVVYALFFRGRILQRGQTVLIHAGSGGVGQAAINICLYFGCEIFTTVGTREKREFIAKTFPAIPQDHICNSRDTSFKADIMKLTNGRGVDIVINSLAGEKLLASLDCVARGGQFLEIGLYDIFMNNTLGMGNFMKGMSFISVYLSEIVNEDTNPEIFMNKMQTLIDDGAIKPLVRHVFGRDQLEPAFRKMAKGEHIGKVVIKIRDEESIREIPPKAIEVDAIPKYYAPNGKCVLICGGLGGLGLELADWLVMNGVTKLVLSSRKGVTTGYQSWCIKNWQSYGVDVIVATEDAMTRESTTKLMNIALSLGPVNAIFNLAATWNDQIFDNQTEESFSGCIDTKVNTTRFLDELSQKMCPDLEHFVVYSSASVSWGNIGLTNYAMANAAIEKIIEGRRAIGLPGLAIEWGPMDDVGLLTTENYSMITINEYVEKQNLDSYKWVLNQLLKQTNLENDMVVVSSFIVAKGSANERKSENILDRIMKALGVKSLQAIDMKSKLIDHGMDSITAVEIRKILDQGAGLSLTPKDLRTLTFEKLLQMENDKKIKG